MDRGAWWVTVHEIAESNKTEQLTLFSKVVLSPHLQEIKSIRALVAQMVQNLPAVRETQVQSLGQEDALEKGKAIHSNILYFLKFYLFILIGG